MAKSSLVIVESPAKAKTIGKYLGPNYQVKACMGRGRAGASGSGFGAGFFSGFSGRGVPPKRRGGPPRGA